MADDEAELTGFLDWDDVEDDIAHHTWEWITAWRRDGMPVTLFTRYDGRLSIHDSDLVPAERAELCRWSFVPMNLPPEGRFWVWSPPSSSRVHRRGGGSKQIVRSSEIIWACLRQRDRKAIRVLRDLLQAEPEELVMHLEAEDGDDEELTA